MTALVESVEEALSSASDTLAKSEAVSKVVAKKRKPILIITVDIGKGKSGDITVFADDSHHNLAVSFCKQHQLSDSLVDAIAKHIRQNVEALQKGRLKKKKEHAARKAREAGEAKNAENTSKDATSTQTSSTVAAAAAGQDTATGPPAAPSTKSILDPPPPHTEPTTTTTTLPSKKKKSKKKKTTKKTKLSSAEENAKVAALLGQEPPPAFVSKSELERRRKAALRKKKEKEERAMRKQKRLDKKRAKRMKAASVVDQATAEKTIGGKKKNKKKKKVDKDVYNRLYNHGMEHWSKVDLTTANRIEEQIKNEEIYTFAPEVHPAPNDAGDSLNAGQEGRQGIHSRLYREGTKSLREKEKEVLRNEALKKQLAFDECTFRPAINARSMELIRRKRMVDSERLGSHEHFDAVQNGEQKGNTESKDNKGKRGQEIFEEVVERNGGKGIFKVLYDPPRFTDKVVMLARQQEEKEMKECTFQPKISKRSRKIVSRKRKLRKRSLDSRGGRRNESRSGHGSRAPSSASGLQQRGPSEYHMSTSISSREQKFNELYQDAERRRNKQDEYYQWQEEQYTFKPDIGVNSIRAHPDNGDQKSFFERLHQSGLAKEEHLKERRHRAKTRDSKTGQKLFHPKVGRSPTFVRNAHGLPVHDFLFASRHEYEDKKKLLLADDRRKRNMNFNKSHVTELSSKLINHARRRKSAEIFLALLPEEEEEGHTIGDHTELDTAVARYDNLPEYIDGELVAVVVLMLQRLNGACITFDEFSTLLDRELEDITNGPIMSILVHNKGRAVGLESTKKQLEQRASKEMTFRPKINKHSNEIANKLGRGESATMPIYELLHKHERKYKMNLKMQQQKQIEQEMEECTFHPKLVASGSQYESMYSRLPGAYTSPTKSSSSAKRTKAPTSNSSYQQPDVWTPSDSPANNGTPESRRGGTHRGPEKVFGRRGTVGLRDGFLGLDGAVVEQNAKLKDGKMKEASPPLISGGKNGHGGKGGRRATPSPSPSKVPNAAVVDSAVATPSTSKTPTKKGVGSSKNLKHGRSATMMHPPPTALNAAEEEEVVDSVSMDDMNDIDRVLAELRTVTKEDDSVGYTTK